MIEFEEAVRRIDVRTRALPVTTMELQRASGFRLAENVRSPFPLPRFDASAVDGYAIRHTDAQCATRKSPITFAVAGTQAAARSGRTTLRSGIAVRILTGAAIPSGCDAVIMQEHVTKTGNAIVISGSIAKGDNIRYAGAEFARGKLLVRKGALLTPPVIAMLATVGRKSVRVHRKPAVALVVSGSELCAPGSKLHHGEIYDSNSAGIIAALTAIGIPCRLTKRVGDNRAQLQQAVRAALRTADVVITSGGVSVGDFDYVKEVYRNLGVKEIFWRVAMKPGKPNYFGVKGRKMVFGVPGNPVAALLSFHLLIRPALEKLSGSVDPPRLWIPAHISRSIRKKEGRVEFLRGIAGAGKGGKLIAVPASGQESHMMGGLAKANCIICFPREKTEIKRGESVAIMLLFWM
jgi:molybdopterin molybdotransferase